LACLTGLIFAGSATAADIYTPVAPEAQQIVTAGGWTFTVAPYFWMAGISGDVGKLGFPTVEVDASFDDILDNLDFAAMAIGEARNGPYSFFGDVIYVKVSHDTGTPRGILATGVELSAETFAGTVGAGYTLLQNSRGHLDVVAGIRVWSVDSELSFSGGILNGVSVSDGATWVDALAGLRGDYSLTDNFYLTGWGLVGGGGADLDWDVAGGLGYRFNDRISSVIGYRALGVDYADDGFVFDVVQQGPILGLVVRF
jgi:hypothetical protein